jgi:hypothetical protein
MKQIHTVALKPHSKGFVVGEKNRKRPFFWGETSIF